MKNGDLESYKKNLLNNIYFDLVDKPTDAFYNLEYLLSKKLNISVGSNIDSDQYKIWENDEEKFIQDVLNVMTWLLDNIEEDQ